MQPFFLQLCWAQIELQAESWIAENFRAQLSSSEQVTVDAPWQFCAENIVFACTPQFAICSQCNSKQLKQRPYPNIHAVMHCFGKKFLCYYPTCVKKVKNMIWKGNSFGVVWLFNFLSPCTDILMLNAELGYGGLFVLTVSQGLY